MARRGIWNMAPGETLDLGVSLDDHLDTGEVLDGTPEVTVWLKSSGTLTDVTSSLAFVVANEQVNTVPLEMANGDEIAIGKGIAFRLTATETEGTYEVRAECDGDDGSHPVTVRQLIVAGPGTPA